MLDKDADPELAGIVENLAVFRPPDILCRRTYFDFVYTSVLCLHVNLYVLCNSFVIVAPVK